MSTLTKKEKQDLANDLDFCSAILEATRGARPLQEDPFHTIADRIRLLEELEKRGFRVVRF